jgi:hypothetical protein
MTNEKYVEEIYYEAHTFGFIDLLRETVDNIYKTTQKISHTDAVFKAYEYLYKNGLIIVKT